jgi:pantothenate synthetase
VADALTLRELQPIEGPALFSMAVVLGTTRLIDNELVG